MKGNDLKKPSCGCMGSKMDMLDSNVSMTANNLLTGRSNSPFHGSPVHKSRSDALDKGRPQVEQKTVDTDPRKSPPRKESGGMPMIIAPEMSRYMPSKKADNVVARLMGLDYLPAQPSLLTTSMKSQNGCSSNPSTPVHRGHQQQEEDRYFDARPQKSALCVDEYEVRKHPSRSSCIIDQPRTLWYERSNATMKEKRMVLLHQILATNDRLLQSKELQDAAEALSSDKDLYHKFPGEPNSLISSHFHQLQSDPPPKNRIVVLKPSTLVDMKSKNYRKGKAHFAVENQGGDPRKYQISASSTYSSSDSLSKQSRIVILKPNQWKPHGIASSVTSNISPPKLVGKIALSRELKADKAMHSRDEVKKFGQQICESRSRYPMDETLLSSFSSHGYAGDDSSISKSGNEYAELEDASFNGSNIATPTTQHSSDYTNSSGDHICSLSLPELSVDRLAKKQISDRWASLASNGVYTEEDQGQRRPTTLAEVLSIPEVKKDNECSRVSSSRSFGEEQDLSVSAACLPIGRPKDEGNSKDSMRNLSRCKSLSSSSANDSIGLNAEVSKDSFCKSIVTKEITCPKNSKSYFSGKVLHLFSHWNKRSARGKIILSPVIGYADQNEDHASSPHSFHEEQKHSSVEEENFAGNQPRPSPDSVLAVPFEDVSHSSISDNDRNSRLLSRAIPIQSVSRHLTFEDTDLEVTLPSSGELCRSLPESNEEEQKWFSFILNLLDGTNSSTMFTRWHAPDKPLHPMLLDKFLDGIKEVDCRTGRVNLKLMFDCVNEALSEISQASTMIPYPGARACNELWKHGPSSSNPLATQVCEFLRSLLSYTENHSSGEVGTSLEVVDKIVTREVGGSEWDEKTWMAMGVIIEEICTQVLEELIGEVLES
ncbi:hypothetical protein J5N97_028783 [Dioscorea zingiberensis]|uniref:DUF4378 domain-containing protein n=1 Tax=Dioscorea zingiberensis TaxID=325984 RepID=A0A9D5H540_9LILI|nr:hypothetical protein J5N97_028783 [Dioscorea zingiberensis]